MDAQFKNIGISLRERNLKIPNLSALRPDANLYTTLALQPGGSVLIEPNFVQANFVGSDKRNQENEKYDSFLNLAVQLNSELVLTPEYSFPWNVLLRAIEANQLPATGNLWIFGCESITPTELRQYIADHPQVEWISEEIPRGPGRFLNVLIYLTRTETTAGVPRSIAVLQFKHEPMGGNTFERDNLILGHVVHIWRNPVDNIRLISLLCSDALVFSPDDENCRFDLHPYLIFHPQLNLEPLHVDLASYRDSLFKINTEHFEVITLNWARGFKLPGFNPSVYGGSAIYTKSPNFRYAEERIEHNHQLGLHFVYWHARRTQLFIFNFDEYVFHFRTPKVSQHILAVEAARTGPEMLSLFKWQQGANVWANAVANDGFHNLCQEFDPNCNYCTDVPYTVVDRERLFMLTSGKLATPNKREGWHHPTNLDSFKTESDERSKRLTFTHEATRESVDYRHAHLSRFIELQSSILTDAGNYPPNINDLVGHVRIAPPNHETHYRFNLLCTNGEQAPATGVFVGSVPHSEAVSVYDEIVRLWGGTDKARRLVVWYRRADNSFRAIVPPTPTFSDDSEFGPSIVKGTTT